MSSIRPLPAELAEKARQELNEDSKTVSSDLQHIKEWIKKQPHLRARTDDQWLLAFLRGCKFSLERTKEKLDMYYALRTTAPDLYKINHKHQLFNEILDLGSFIFLPKGIGLTKPAVALVRPGAYDPNKYTVSEVVSVSNVIEKIILMENDNAIISGVQNILDLENVTMGHFLQMTPVQMKKMVVHMQEATPFRVKGTHYLNTPKGFEVIFNAMKNLLNEKNKSRLYVHNKNYEEMYKHIPKDILPAEYGGNGGTIKEIVEYWKQKVREYSAFLDEDLQYGTDESKRPGKPKTAEDMFGVEGSFRQLEFD
ncbi:alpha-tocopherol transfer protein-like [Galleria mellonella]|uniref:Alpha-tocopherol transfer protein-like n=1 Tax=Galleria mellonella TaxID=7137 RepID=A0A6J1WWZ7_GALME|nr:alpha-tocopherol transfer protein-like [Galleria mellonella]